MKKIDDYLFSKTIYNLIIEKDIILYSKLDLFLKDYEHRAFKY